MRTSITFVLVLICATASVGEVAALGMQDPPDPEIHAPVNPREVDRLRRQIAEETSSRAEADLEVRDETGDKNEALQVARVEGHLDLLWRPDTRLQATVSQTAYLPEESGFRHWGTNLTVGMETLREDQRRAHFEVGATRFTTETVTINALASLPLPHSGPTTFRFTASRTNVDETLLSATGLRPVEGPFAGELVGRVMENRFALEARRRIRPEVEIRVEGAAGYRAGANVASNPLGVLSAMGSYDIVSNPRFADVHLVRAGYELHAMGFRDNRFGFGGSSLLSSTGRSIPPEELGSDGIPPDPGGGEAVGGYFSPRGFVRHGAFLEARGTTRTDVRYHLVSFLGEQRYTEAERDLAVRLSASATFSLGTRLSLPIEYTLDTTGPFTRQQLSAGLSGLF